MFWIGLILGWIVGSVSALFILGLVYAGKDN